ncbi:MAG TPA: DUF445 domain-containing protein [Candidatus Binatia bacterium]|nr:DUF445 domain-containing protein [Candidatus Binatia bacterium]
MEVRAARRRNRVGTVSLVAAVAGAAASRVGLAVGPFAGAAWLRLLAAGFEAAVVGGLADWFAVTALFRHPLGVPIPHTAIIPARRAKITESIVTMVQDEWLSPQVIGARLARIAPSAVVADWLADPARVARLGAPLRDMLRGLARSLAEDEVAGFIGRMLQHQLRELPLDASAGAWLERAVESESAGAAFESLASSLANLAERPRTAAELHYWLDRSARTLYASGRRLMPWVLRQKVVQRKIIEAACNYASSELRQAAGDLAHPLRRALMGALTGFADRLAAGDEAALAQARRLRSALLESLETGPVVRATLARLRDQLEHDLAEPSSGLSDLIDRRLRSAILDLLGDPERRATFDRWVRTTATDLLHRHHDQIGLTVRESLEALETGALVAQIEDRVGQDLQFIRLNGAVVGGLVGLALAVAHWVAG